MTLFNRLTLVFLGAVGILLLSTLATFAIRLEHYVWTPWSVAFLLVVPSLLLLAIGHAFVKGAGARLNLTLLVIASVSALYVCELYLVLAGPYVNMPPGFDRRSKLEVVLELRRNGKPAVPSTHPMNILPETLEIGGRKALPLGGIARRPTVFCNETGTYYIYEADEYGFTNPPGTHRTPLDLVLIGDSFTQGFCAPSGTSYAELIRRAVPRALNLGHNGNGPLVELATFREFATPLSPKYVFWFYYEGNDIEDLSRELTHPILKRYIEDPQFTQNQIANAPEFDRALRSFVEERLEREKLRTWNVFAELINAFPLWSKLWNTRRLLGLTDLKREWPLKEWAPGVSREQADNALSQIIHEAHDRVARWGGKFVLVYLPAYRTFHYRLDHPWREQVLAIARQMNVPVIDMLPIFQAHSDPIGLYNHRTDAHYTTAGNAFVAQAVLAFLVADQFLPGPGEGRRAPEGIVLTGTAWHP